MDSYVTLPFSAPISISKKSRSGKIAAAASPYFSITDFLHERHCPVSGQGISFVQIALQITGNDKGCPYGELCGLTMRAGMEDAGC